MSNSNLKASQRASLAGTLKPAPHAIGSHYSDWIDLGQFETMQAIANVGAMAGIGKLELQQSTTNTDVGAKAIEDREPVSLSADTPAIINLRADELDVNMNFRFVRAKLVATGGAITAGINLLGHNSRYQPAQLVDGTVVDG